MSIFKNNGRLHLLVHNFILSEKNVTQYLIVVFFMKQHSSSLHSAPINYFQKLENHKRQFLKIPYSNKGMDLIDVASIFKHPKVAKQVPVYYEDILES